MFKLVSAWLGLRRPSPTSPEELAKWKYKKRIPDTNWPDGSPMFKDCWIVSNDKQTDDPEQPE